MNLQEIKQVIAERKLTAKETAKKEEIAKAIERENPGMGSTPEGMSKKMAIATAQAKKCSEEVEELGEVSNYDLVVNYYRHLGLDPYKLRGTVGKQLRAKIKASPAFQAWAKINSSFEYDKQYSTIIEALKAAKKEANSGKSVVTFLNYPDVKNTANSDSFKSQAETDNNYITPN